MKIPLLCDVRSESLEIVSNGRLSIRSLPFPPHIYIPITKAGPRTLTRRRIGTEEDVEISRVEYDTVDELEKVYMRTECHKLHYIEQIYTEEEDYFLQYPNTNPLRILVLDIEVLTDGSGIFPRASSNPIVAIGMKVVGGDEYIYAAPQDELDSPGSDGRILREMMAQFKLLNPDIIGTYNGVRFDLPYLMERMRLHDLNPDTLCRNVGEFSPEGIHHRIHWDMWKDVDGDQTLLGLANRRLKTVGNHFGWSNIIDLGREALSNTSTLVGTPELEEYLSSDLHLTENLTSVYINNHIALAEMMGIPLREMMHSYNSLIPKIQHIRALKGKYIGLQTNADRYMSRIGTMRYEAARVAGYIDGVQVDTIQKYYPEVWKIDFSSQYPSAMITFNLGPDTTRIMEFRTYTGEYQFHRSKDYLWLNLPDKNMMKQVIIRVDQRRNGFLRDRLSTINSERAIVKRLMVDDPDNKELYSRGWGYKVEANTIYGYEGLTSSKWGDLGTAIATVGLCRYLILHTEDWIGESKIETDSVTGATPICIQRDGKYIDFLPISELVPDYAYEKKSIRYAHGNSDIKVLTRNGWSRILYVKQHEVTKNIYRVNTTDGYVEVTEDHSLFRDTMEEVTPADLSVDDTIEVTYIFPVEHEVDHSEEFAWLLGFILAEGTVSMETPINGSRYRYELVINNQDIDLLQKCSRILESHYQVQCRIYNTMDSSGVDKLIKNDKAMVSNLYHLCYTPHGHKKVPLFVLNSPQNIKNAFLSGIWEGDGHHKVVDGRTHNTIDSVHQTLAAGVRYLINSTGERTGINIRSDKPNVITIKKRTPRKNGYVRLNEGRVKKIEKLDVDHRWVYDISTDDGTFVTGLGGIVLHNTDGIYSSATVDIEDINGRIASTIEDTFGVPCQMSVELDTFGCGYFYKTKNYILRQLDGKMTRHGTAFKSSRHSRVYEKALGRLCEAILDQVEDPWPLIQEVKEWDQYNVADFIHHTSFNQNPEEYSNPNTVQPRLARMAKDRLGVDLRKGDSIDYIITTGHQYTIASEVTTLGDIDLEYYSDDIDKIIRILDMGRKGVKGEFIIDSAQPLLF